MRIAYYSNTFGSLDFSPIRTPSETISQTGLNLGNLAFANIGHKLFEGEKFIFNPKASPESVRNSADIVVFCVANWLNKSTDLGWLADRIVQIDRPVVLMGIGAQSELEGGFPDVPEGTKRFVRECAARTSNIMVRGKFTADLCRSFGVDNVVALGCPSILTEKIKNLGEVVRGRWNQATDRMAFHILEIQERLAQTEQHLMAIARQKSGSAVIVQHQEELIELLNSGGRDFDKAQLAKARWISKFLSSALEADQVLQWLRQHLFYFDDIDAWRRFLRNYSGSLNTRIHGTIVTLSAGVPGVCLYHDSRTKELAETMKIPSLYHKSIVEGRMSAEDIFHATTIDAESFDGNRHEIASRYLENLAEIGLEPSAHLVNLAS